MGGNLLVESELCERCVFLLINASKLKRWPTNTLQIKQMAH